MAFVFHVEFGMNDTPLTQALEQGNCATAEQIILDCPHASYLDDGCYQRIPLYICLCGVDEYHQRVAPRNLHLARLLIENGANVNHRVPVTNFGSEYLSPGKSCLELLVDFYIDLPHQTLTPTSCSPCHSYQLGWNPLTELVIGLNQQYLTTLSSIKEDVQDLIFDILRHGGDPNVIDENRMTPAHRVAMFCSDASLFKLLCDNGASPNAVDASGNTLLLALCSVSALENDDSADRLSPTSDSDVLEVESVSREDLMVKSDFLQYLLKVDDVDVNHQNQLGQTALFHCILRGDIQAARTLLDANADPGLQGYVWMSRQKRRKLSPLFASLLSIPQLQNSACCSVYEQITRTSQIISPLVDAGYFTTEKVAEELSTMIEHDFPEFSHLRSSSASLVHLMFGHKSTSLKQLAARKVFQFSLIESTACLHNILPISSIQDNFSADDLHSDMRKFEEYITLVLNCTVLHRLMELVMLPRTLLIHLEAQLLFLRLCLKYHACHPQRPSHNSVVALNFRDDDLSDPGFASPFEDNGEDSSSYESTSEDDVEGDSDLEYW